MKTAHTLRNVFGLNDWAYFNLVENPPEYEYDQDYYEFRICKITGRFQQCHTHCFGLNPPTYTKHWTTKNRKPKIKLVNGVYRVS